MNFFRSQIEAGEVEVSGCCQTSRGKSEGKKMQKETSKTFQFPIAY